MGFGYTFMKGQSGMEGYIRETAGKRTVQVRGLPAGAQCALYALYESGARRCAQGAADQSGQCRLTVPESGPLFAAVDGKVRLWEGGDETYLRACAFLQSQDEPRPREDKKPVPEDADLLSAARTPAKEPDVPMMEEDPPYTLRPAGTGENVDALPPRKP